MKSPRRRSYLKIRLKYRYMYGTILRSGVVDPEPDPVGSGNIHFGSGKFQFLVTKIA